MRVRAPRRVGVGVDVGHAEPRGEEVKREGGKEGLLAVKSKRKNVKCLPRCAATPRHAALQDAPETE